MPKIDIASLPVRTSTGYPGKLAEAVKGRARKQLGDAVGLDQFGVNLTRLAPGAASALKHWHEKEDELVFVLEGEAVLVEGDAETVLKAGEAAGFKANVAVGHCIVNRSDGDVVLLEIGTRSNGERGHYPGEDLLYDSSTGKALFTHLDGTPY
ncbi:cupin domain-containing protein [Breoghania sp. L-A4]|uniref:cupin domain-containing protein n=1 Tax=Breoghania sp. L-A4 TaxID=2304600 RepID=UPI000E35E9A5|nr:cupin domain-containing protein [Breoghania sp. L-A4]AXS39662.1 cupin domain-containing protein [Breoghania sp. L-A4]